MRIDTAGGVKFSIIIDKPLIKISLFYLFINLSIVPPVPEAPILSLNDFLFIVLILGVGVGPPGETVLGFEETFCSTGVTVTHIIFMTSARVYVVGVNFGTRLIHMIR